MASTYHSPPSLFRPTMLLLLVLIFTCLSFTTTLASPPMHLKVENYTVSRIAHTTSKQYISQQCGKHPPKLSHSPFSALLTLSLYSPLQILVNGSALFIQGVCYNPAQLGTAPAWTPPWGDYLRPEFRDIWERDFPLMKEMGVNTVRVWQWDNNQDHGLFLDTAFQHGLKVIVTFYIGNSGQFPVQLDWQRQQTLGAFRWQVGRYLHHPALLAWSFGAEINAPWNNYLQAFSNAFGCGWSGATAPTGCFGDPLTAKESGCHQSIACVYQHVFEFVNTAAIYAKQEMAGKPSHLILAGLADVDVMTSRLGMYEHFAPDVDGWAVQVYRGRDFGVGKDDLLAQYERRSRKPLVVSEYGVDAYNDPCGTQDNSPCFNFAHDPPSGYGEDEDMQAEWLLGMTELLVNHSSAKQLGPVAGACVYEWLDEYWHSTSGVTGCYGPITYGNPGFNPQQCDWKAHVDCPESDLWYHSLCGYPSTSFDRYTNTAWFGLMKVYPGSGGVDTVVARKAYDRLKALWGESSGGRGWVWMWLVLAVLSAGLAVAGLLYVRWMRRYAELERLGRVSGRKEGWWKVWERGAEFEPIETVDDIGSHDNRDLADRTPLMHATR